jgi:hypothetical protein
MLVDSRDDIIQCDGTIDALAEARFAKEKSALEVAIVANAHLSPGHTTEAAQAGLKHHLASQGHMDDAQKKQTCVSAQTTMFRQMFDSLTSAETAAKIIEGAKAAADPYDGVCL